jgi:hypothetical protein
MIGMTQMLPSALSVLSRSRLARVVGSDPCIVAALVGLDAAARLLPHAPNFTPIAASALFAATVLRVRAFSLVVPVAALLVGDALHGFYDWRIMATVYAALSLPAGAACLSRSLRAPRMIVPVMLSSALIFFLLTNFAVWAFGSMYAANATGLLTCYTAALPFLKYTIAGDLFWAAALFGGYYLVRHVRADIGKAGAAAAGTTRRL